MRPKAALLILTIAVLCRAANSPFYLPIRNNDLPAIRRIVHDSGPNLRDDRVWNQLVAKPAPEKPPAPRHVIDVYRGKLPAVRSLPEFALYDCFSCHHPIDRDKQRWTHARAGAGL